MPINRLKIQVQGMVGFRPDRFRPWEVGALLRCPERPILLPMIPRWIPVGISVAMPYDYIGLIVGASSGRLQVQTQVIDARHREPLRVLVTHTGALPRRLPWGAAVAQLIALPAETVDYVFGLAAETAPTSPRNPGFRRPKS